MCIRDRVIGNDASGNEFINLMKSQKMITEGLITASDRQTITKTRIMGNNVQMLRVDDEKDVYKRQHNNSSITMH